MASTRNNTTRSDYCLQQRSYQQSRDYIISPFSPYGVADQSAFPCVGINMGHMPSKVLSRNPVDIESGLFGINSTNLVDPQPRVIAEINNMQQVSFFPRKPVYLPDPLVQSATQRPFPVPK